jgi:DNA repair protein RecO (recombination protein O)
MGTPRRVLLEPAFLLHQRDYRDSSRIIEFFSRGHGRVCLFAKGVRRPGSAFTAVLQPFVPLLVSWAGPGDGGTLIAAEFIGAPPRLPPAALMSGFYLNELLLKLLGREDPYPEVHEAYALALEELRAAPGAARPLRLFEKRLLEALGLGIDYAHLAAGGPALDADAYYHVEAQQGVVSVPEGAEPTRFFRGRDLLSLAAEVLADEASLAAAKRLLRAALAAPLDGRELATRSVARALGERARAAPVTAPVTAPAAAPDDTEGNTR